jgi:hypothetical protein
MHGRREAHVSAAGREPGSVERDSDSRPGGHAAGHDRRPPGSNPKPPERWRHLRTGIVASVVYVAPDESFLYTSESGVAWPMEMFLAHWERT